MQSPIANFRLSAWIWSLITAGIKAFKQDGWAQNKTLVYKEKLVLRGIQIKFFSLDQNFGNT